MALVEQVKDEEPFIKRIIRLEMDILENCAENCQYLSELFQFLEPSRKVSDPVRIKCLHTVRRVLPILYQTFHVNLFSQETEPQTERSYQQVEKWLKKQAKKLCAYFEDLCVSHNEHVAKCALWIGTSVSAQFNAWHPLFERQVRRILVSKDQNEFGTENWNNFVEDIFSVYGDVALYSLQAILHSLQQSTKALDDEETLFLWRVYELLSKGAQLIPKFRSNSSSRLEEKVNIGVTKIIGEDVFHKRLRKTFTDAWISFLSLKLPEHLEYRILEQLGSNIIPWMTRPLLLVDYLSGLAEQRGIVSIMALDALFVLIRDYGLDYPSFYDKLYSLLTVRNLTVAQNTFLRFMSKLLLTCLNISEQMIMAFVKKLVRLATRLPPLPCKWCLTCAIQLMLKYPSLACLVHRNELSLSALNSDSQTNHNTTKFVSTNELFMPQDPFDECQTKCEASHVASTSLWELQLIQHHYMKSICEQFQYFKTDWGLQRMKRKTSALPSKPEDVLEVDIKQWLEQPKKRKQSCDYIWKPELPYSPLDLIS